MLHWLADKWGIPSVAQLSMSLEPGDLLDWYAFFSIQHEESDGLLSPERLAEQLPKR